MLHKVMLKGADLRCNPVPSGEKVTWSSPTSLAVQNIQPGRGFWEVKWGIQATRANPKSLPVMHWGQLDEENANLREKLLALYCRGHRYPRWPLFCENRTFTGKSTVRCLFGIILKKLTNICTMAESTHSTRKKPKIALFHPSLTHRARNRVCSGGATFWRGMGMSWPKISIHTSNGTHSKEWAEQFRNFCSVEDLLSISAQNPHPGN